MKHKVIRKTKLHLEKMGKNHVRVLSFILASLETAEINNMAEALGLAGQHVDRIVADYESAADNFFEFCD